MKKIWEEEVVLLKNNQRRKKSSAKSKSKVVRNPYLPIIPQDFGTRCVVGIDPGKHSTLYMTCDDVRKRLTSSTPMYREDMRLEQRRFNSNWQRERRTTQRSNFWKINFLLSILELLLSRDSKPTSKHVSLLKRSSMLSTVTPPTESSNGGLMEGSRNLNLD